MARPERTGLDYFPLDTTWETNMKLIKARFKLAGVGCITELWRSIYREGYALKWDEDTQILFSSENGIDLEDLQKIVLFAAEKGIFSAEILSSKGVLTSHGIQKRWEQIAKQLRRANIKIPAEINLLDENEFPREETPLIPELTPLIPEFSTQMKGKEMKGKEKKEEFDATGQNPADVKLFENEPENPPDDFDPVADFDPGANLPPEPAPSIPALKVPQGPAQKFSKAELAELQAMFPNTAQKAIEIINLKLQAGDYKRIKHPWAFVKTWLVKETSPQAWLERQLGAKPNLTPFQELASKPVKRPSESVLMRQKLESAVTTEDIDPKTFVRDAVLRKNQAVSF